LNYLLDTNACIGFLNGRSRTVLEKLEATPDDQASVCSVVKAEMVYGAMKSRDPAQGNDYWPGYGRVSAGGVCPPTNSGLPCDVMVTVSEARPGELAVMTLVPE